MTTNITPIEALEKIKEELNYIRFNSCDSEKEWIEERVSLILDIVLEALAPQEYCDGCGMPKPKDSLYCDTEGCFFDKHRIELTPQECEFDNTDCYFLYTHDDMKNYESECTFPLSEYKDCAKNNCVFKQLHSQEKTFTQYEVRDILNGVLLDYLDKPSVDAYRLDVLKQFKKAVG